jgi:hypothetical protein
MVMFNRTDMQPLLFNPVLYTALPCRVNEVSMGINDALIG